MTRLGRHHAGTVPLQPVEPFQPYQLPRLHPAHRAPSPTTTLGGSMSNALGPVPAYARLPYWRELLDRAGRNAVQTVIPVLIAAQVGSVTGFDPLLVLWAAAAAGLVTVVKALTGLSAGPSTTLVWRLADRAVPAAAATLLSFLTLDGVSIVTSVDWRAAGVATVAAALGAIAQAYVSPAVVATQDDVDLAA